MRTHRLVARFPVLSAAGLALTAVSLVLCRFEPEFVGSISLKAYDAFMQAIQEPPKSDRIVIVDIDEDSLEGVGQWPWPRHTIAELARRILDGGAAVLAFDIVFAEPDGKSPRVVREHLRREFGLDVRTEGIPAPLDDYDRIFAGVLSNAQRRTVLGCFLFPSDVPLARAPTADPYYRGYFYVRGAPGAGDVSEFLIHARKICISIPILNAAAGNNGFFNSWPDADNVVRRIPLIVACGPERIYPALSIEAVRMALGIRQIGIEYDTLGVQRLRLKDMVIPTDPSGRMIVNFRTPIAGQPDRGFRAFPSCPARAVLSGAVPANAFSNKIVFVGSSAPGLRDLRATPLTTSRQLEPEVAGVEVHATIVDNILSGDILFKPWWSAAVDVVSILLMGLFLTLLAQRARPWTSFILALTVVTAAVYASYWAFLEFRFVFVPIRLLLTALLVYPVLVVIRLWQEERQKRVVRTLFETMVSPEILRYLEKNPGSFSLTGRRVEATTMFSDIAGFTAISESLPPDRLSALLNRYLSPMAEIITGRGGYLDKYEGDLIMAEWGVPFATSDHAVQACLAAVEQQERLEVLRPVLKAEFGCDIHVRIGLNTGSVTAGNMGSDRKYQYTVIGDAVNLARRLEPANRDYGTRILAGEATVERVRSVIEFRRLDRIVVRGRTRPVDVYEVLGRAGDVPTERLAAMRLYEEALRLHWERDWDGALDRLREVLRARPDDGPALLLAGRIEVLRRQPPGPEWAGEHLREEKE